MTEPAKKTTYQRRREAGLCGRCGGIPEEGKSLCGTCGEKERNRVKSEYEWYQINRICPRCRTESILGDEKMCPECRAKNSERMQKYNEQDDGERRRRLARKSYKSVSMKRREDAICTRCGKRKADSGRKTCGICRAKLNKAQRDWHERNSVRCTMGERKERSENGRCFHCGEPAKEGYKVCEKHYQSLAPVWMGEAARESRERIKQRIHMCIQRDAMKREYQSAYHDGIRVL